MIKMGHRILARRRTDSVPSKAAGTSFDKTRKSINISTSQWSSRNTNK
jgi:hypothetical protein